MALEALGVNRMNKTLKCDFCISKVSKVDNSGDESWIRIGVIDKLSGLRVVSVDVPLDKFTLALTGLYINDIDFQVNPESLKRIGLKRITENRSTPYSGCIYDSKKAREYVMSRKEDYAGYDLDKSSIWIGAREDDKTNIHYKVIKYVSDE